MDLNRPQMEAIQHNKGTMLVLAGPGSGKTLVITRRTQELITTYRVKPERILVITFTKAAAAEMKDRFCKLCGSDGTRVNFGTFHAVFFKILQYAYNLKSNSIIREDERFGYLREALFNMRTEVEDDDDYLASVAAEISKIKNERIDIANYYSLTCPEDSFRKLYNDYQAFLRNTHRVDFDDMLLLCYELLTKRPDILACWQQKYEYILIDEFQDSNRLQYDIIKLLAAPQNNIFIVGDDDQSIYRFRGARPELMKQFTSDYKDTKTILLDCNYRCSGRIVESAAKVIANNKQRFSKKITATREGSEASVRSMEFETYEEQNDYLRKRIQENFREGIPYSSQAVLYRTNTQPRALIALMMEYNIPFTMKDRIPNLYEHWVSKNILTYLEIAAGCMDRGAFLKIMNRPKRYLSRECLANKKVTWEEMYAFYKDKQYVVDKIERMEYDIRILSRLNPYAGVNYIRHAIGYDSFLREYAEYRGIKLEELLDTANELQECSRDFNTVQEWLEYIAHYGEEIKRKQDEIRNKPVDGVAFMTFHSSKGLEFNTVYIPDVCEGIMPHRRAILPEDVEEERRMFYVAMTRARNELCICHPKERHGKHMPASRFLQEIKLPSV